MTATRRPRRCRVWRGDIVIELPQHNAAFCRDHFLRYCRDQVAKTIKEFAMVEPGDRLLVAVSGGKDSLALWDIVSDLGYEADGLYVGLGIGGYSDASGQAARRFAAERGRHLVEIDLREHFGFDVGQAAEATGRVPCSACGLSKRHVFDRAALDGGYDALLTGHNLDDEAAVLFGNTLRWEVEYLARQKPVLPAGENLPRKAKPLVRLTERETAAYCVLTGIDYQVEECPMAAGNRHLQLKDALQRAEAASPGTKTAFYLGFQRKARVAFEASLADGQAHQLRQCARCGSASSNEICSFCRLRERMTTP